MELNNNTPIYSFISSAIKEKNNLIKENVLLGNINFPDKILYSPKILMQSEDHIMFLDNLSNKISLEKIKEEKQILNNKIEISNIKIKNIKKQYNYESAKKPLNKNKNILPKLLPSNILPTIKEKSKQKPIKTKLLIEIKPLPTKKSNQLLIDKMLNKENEYDLEQNAKEFIRKINNFKINNITLKKQKQKRDLLRLKQEIAIAEKRKQREEYELLKKREEMKQNILKRQYMKDFNNYNMNPPKVHRYHYYNPNSAKKRNKISKNFSYAYNNYNNNEYIYQYYNNNNINNINNINNGYNIYPNINPYPQMIVNNFNDNEIRNTENLGHMQNESNNNSNIIYKDSNNYSIINETRSNNSILNTSEKKHLYYFNDLKYEN